MPSHAFGARLAERRMKYHTQGMKVLRVGIPAILLVALSSCASLPLPAAHDQALFVLPLELENPDEDLRPLSYELTLERTSREGDRQTVRFTFPASAGYVALPLDPGLYTYSSRDFNLLYREQGDSQIRRERVWGGSSIFVGERTVTIWGRSVRARLDGDADTRVGNASTAKREEIARALLRNPRWRAWETHDRVGFP